MHASKRSLVAATTVLSFATLSRPALASYTVHPYVQVSPDTQFEDFDPDIVAMPDGSVFIAWLHSESTAPLDRVGQQVDSVRVSPDAMFPVPLDMVLSTRVSEQRPTAVAVAETDGNIGPIQVIGLLDTALATTVVVTGPGTSTQVSVSGLTFTHGDIVDLNVPAHLRQSSAGGAFSLPIGITVRDRQTSDVTATGLEVQLSSGPSVNVPMRYATLMPGAFADMYAIRTGYLGAGVPAFVASQRDAITVTTPMQTPVDRNLGVDAINARPAITNTESGGLYGVLRVFNRLDCRNDVYAMAPTDCGDANGMLDLDADADRQHPDDVWFAGAGTSGVYVGSSFKAQDVERLPDTGLDACGPARIAALRNDTGSVNERAIVVASCSQHTTRHVFAWIVERIPSSAPTDAGTTDASVEDSSLPNDDVVTSGDASTLEYRGSGCACRATGSRNDPRDGAVALASLAVTIATVRRRRRRAQ